MFAVRTISGSRPFAHEVTIGNIPVRGPCAEGRLGSFEACIVSGRERAEWARGGLLSARAREGVPPCRTAGRAARRGASDSVPRAWSRSAEGTAMAASSATRPAASSLRLSLSQITRPAVSHAGDGKISSYVYEEARVEEAKARESRKLALEARNFEREARDAVASGSSEALRRLRRVEVRLNKLEDAHYKHLRDLDLERDNLKSLYGVKMVGGFWQGEGPMTVGPSVPERVIAERLKEWQQGKQVV